MKTTTLCSVAYLFAVTSWAFAVSVDRDITADYVKANPKEFTVSVTEEANGLLAFTVVFATPDPRYVVAHLVVRDSEKIYATSDTPSFTKNRSNNFHFSVPREFVATSTFYLGVAGFADSGGEAVPRPGTIENKFQLLDFVPKKVAATSRKMVLPALINALRTGPAVNRQFAAQALGVIGPSATEARDALKKSTDDESQNVRRAATAALARIDEASALK